MDWTSDLVVGRTRLANECGLVLKIVLTQSLVSVSSGWPPPEQAKTHVKDVVLNQYGPDSKAGFSLRGSEELRGFCE